MRARLLHYMVILLMIPMLSGCWLLAVGGAGAYGGYKAKEAGYGVQNPIAGAYGGYKAKEAGYGVQNPIAKDKKAEDQKK